MHRTLSRVAALLAVLATLVLVPASPAFAHEQRQVGAYQFTVGWEHEPTYTGFENGVQLFIKDAKGNPVDDLGDPPSIKVQVVSGGQTSDPLDLKASFDADTGLGTHGEFDAAFIPTAPGNFTFHLTGTVNGQKVDESFTSSDKTFDPVKDPAEIEFPAKVPTNAQLATSISRITPRVDTAMSLAQADQRAAKKAKDQAATATTLAIVAIAVGVVIGLLGIIIGRSGRRPAAQE
jgi:hypothetical protein